MQIITLKIWWNKALVLIILQKKNYYLEAYEHFTKRFVMGYIFQAVYNRDWFHVLEENAFSTLRVKSRNPAYERQSAASITTSIAFNEMYGLKKNMTAMEPLCQTLSCANAPSCYQKEIKRATKANLSYGNKIKQKNSQLLNDLEEVASQNTTDIGNVDREEFAMWHYA